MPSQSRTLVFLCNALDDETRIERGISTDSPAASRKVLQLARAARLVGVKPIVLSLGRGRAGGRARYFRGFAKRVEGVPIVYLPFTHLRIVSELLSMVAPIGVLLRLRKRPGRRAVMFYNRMVAYFPAAIAARATGFRTVLDLEDGEIDVESSSAGGLRSRLKRWSFDALCSAGAIVACRALERATRLHPTECCYGTAESVPACADWNKSPITVLFGGTVSRDTGAPLLSEAIGLLRRSSTTLSSRLRFEITGKGDAIAPLEALAADARHPEIVVHGRTTSREYAEIMKRSHVGLALKPNSGQLAHTTFPSKVVELASHGILVLSTDISDVRLVLREGALYLTVDDPAALVEQLRWIVESRETASVKARQGAQAVADRCAPAAVGAMLDRFVFESSAANQVNRE